MLSQPIILYTLGNGEQVHYHNGVFLWNQEDLETYLNNQLAVDILIPIDTHSHYKPHTIHLGVNHNNATVLI